MEPIAPFSSARLPRLRFGSGALDAVPQEARAFGTRALLVTGARSAVESGVLPRLRDGMAEAGLDWTLVTVADEPSPELVDAAVAEQRGRGVEVVIGLGGGSALDAAKAIAGLLPGGGSVMDHLEGVGRGVAYRGPATPFVAVPTTAGTGSEATRNAVLSRRGPDGFKKSFRDEALVPRVAVLDPDLLASCPPAVMAANGMDAFTQLLEAYTSVNASPLTDAFAWSGLESFRCGFFPAWRNQDAAEAAAGRGHLAWAAYCSGVALAQAGLGAVHGLASPLGAWFPIPHGAVCGTLVAEATAVNLATLEARAPGSAALGRYARVGRLLAGAPGLGEAEARAALVERLRRWLDELGLPRLGRFGVGPDEVGRVVAGSRGGSMRTNPIVLEDGEIAAILERRL